MSGADEKMKTHANSRKTHCPQGHEYTPKNTRVYRGSRRCKACGVKYSGRCKQKPTAKEHAKRYIYAQLAKHPDKVHARRAVQNKIHRGTMVKPKNCAHCGKYVYLESHHYKGYAWENRYDVIWLCRRCRRAAEPRPTDRNPYSILAAAQGQPEKESGR